MSREQLSLDRYSQHYLQVSLDKTNLIIDLLSSYVDRRSTLHNSFKHNLFFRLLETDYWFPEHLERLVLPGKNSLVEVFLGKFELIKLATIKIGEDALTITQHYTFSPFETRFLAQNGFPHPIKEYVEDFTPQLTTDLHTHFAGCVSAKALIQIGIEHNVSYPSELLELAGIHTQEKTALPLGHLSLELRRILEQRLCIPLDRRIPFIGMEKIYRLRAPITKNLDTFIPLCRQIARDYQAMGVKYVELSFGNSIYANYLRLLHQEIPQIEQDTGVTLRFLAAIGRRDDLEWDLDYIAQIKQNADSRYLVGVDFLGHETNSTYKFARQLREICQWADQEYPGFVIRVHAGENPAHPENIRAALELTQDYQVQLRIGHGLFGVDRQTLQKLKEMQAIVEFNLNSNLALNNIQTAQEVPLKQYLDFGIPVVLGSDGYGIYQTGAKIEAQAALLAGLTKEDFEKIYQTEATYYAKRLAWDANKPQEFVIPDDLPPKYYTKDVLIAKQAAKQARDQALLARLAAIKIPLLDQAEVNNLLREKQVISIAGAWYKSWDLISPNHQERIYQELDRFLAALNPQNIVIVTGGTSFGIANVVQQRAMPLGFTVLATLVKDTPPMWLEAGSVSYFCIVAEDLYDKAAGLYQLMKEHNGLCVFIGGGNIVSDEIQAVCNLRLNYLLMQGPEGASSLHAQQHPDRAFTCAEEILAALENSRPWNSVTEPYWHLGANLTVDIILTRHNPETNQLELLLIRRDDYAQTEPGKWALPGGFQLTDAPRGTFWQPGRETVREACIRELLEETSLDIKHLASELIFVGSYEGEGRDPRDTAEAWSRSTVFALHLPKELANSTIAGADDACDASWWLITDIPTNLAFDHNKILKDGLAIIGHSTKGTFF